MSSRKLNVRLKMELVHKAHSSPTRGNLIDFTKIRINQLRYCVDSPSKTIPVTGREGI
jgi:hypothetical protein